MPTWSYLSNFKGYLTSPAFPIQLDGDGALTKFTWDAVTPIGTSIKMQTNVSLDGGFTWNGWKSVISGGSIPDVTTNTNLSNMHFKYRATMESNDKVKTPELINVNMEYTPVIEFNNDGDYTLFPEVWITKVSAGDISLINTTNSNQEFKFTGLVDNETVYVNCERELIKTDLALTYRYDNFNDKYLEILRGRNILKVVGNAKLIFRYQFKTIQG